MLTKFGAEHLGSSHKTRKYLLTRDTADRLVEPDGDLSAEEQRYLNNFPFRSIIGAARRRADISLAVGVLSRFSSKPIMTI